MNPKDKQVPVFLSMMCRDVQLAVPAQTGLSNHAKVLTLEQRGEMGIIEAAVCPHNQYFLVLRDRHK